jgi:predicted transcriptional regulator
VYSKEKDDSKALEVVHIIHALSNDSSLLLFDAVADSDGTSDLLISKLNLTRKQFYSRMSSLVECGLVGRKNGKYILTSFGKIIYSVIMNLKKASEFYSNLKVIDLVKTSNNNIFFERTGYDY